MLTNEFHLKEYLFACKKRLVGLMASHLYSRAEVSDCLLQKLLHRFKATKSHINNNETSSESDGGHHEGDD